MSFYQVNFATLVAANAVLAYRQYRQAIWQEITPKTTPDIEKSARKGEIDQFTKDFFVVYLLVVAADWLQVSITIAPLHPNNQQVDRALTYMRCTDMRKGFQKDGCRTLRGWVHRWSD